MPWRENKGVANLNGIYTDGFGLPVGKKSLEEILIIKNGLWPEMLWIHGAHGGHGSSEFKRNLYGWFGVACRQEIFGGNLFKKVAYARNIFNSL